MKYLLPLLIILLQIGCSTNKNKTEGGENILSSSNGQLSYPEWAYEKPRYIDNDTLFVTGAFQINPDQNVNACLSAALLNAKANLAAEINSRIEKKTQLGEEGFEVGQNSLQNMIHEFVKIDRLTSSSEAKRWFGKTSAVTSGKELATIKCFVQISMGLPEFKQNVYAAVVKIDPSVSKDFKNKLEREWSSFFGPEPKSEAPATN